MYELSSCDNETSRLEGNVDWNVWTDIASWKDRKSRMRWKQDYRSYLVGFGIFLITVALFLVVLYMVRKHRANAHCRDWICRKSLLNYN